MKNMVDELLESCEDCEKKENCPGYNYGLKMKEKGAFITEKQIEDTKLQMAMLSMFDMLEAILIQKLDNKSPPIQYVINHGRNNSDGSLN